MRALLRHHSGTVALLLTIAVLLNCKSAEEAAKNPLDLGAVGAHVAIDIDTDAVGGGAFAQFPNVHPKVTLETSLDVGRGSQDFGEFTGLSPQAKTTLLADGLSYTVVQLHGNVRYPIPRAEDATVEIAPFGGLVLYHFRYGDCEGDFCSDNTVALNLGVGFTRGPLGLDAFTGVGDVPTFSLRLKYALKQAQ